MNEHRAHTGHGHLHGPARGHTSQPHADHVDDVHDEHRHRAHGRHWDECEIEQAPAGDQIVPHGEMTTPEEPRTSAGT